MLLITAVLSGYCDPANAEARWFQIPAQGLWVDVPKDWDVKADAKNSLLLLSDGTGARLEIFYAARTAPDVALEGRRQLLVAEFGELKWKKPRRGLGLSAKASPSGVATGVAVTVVKGANFALAVTSIAPPKRGKAVTKLAKHVLKTFKAQWKRPGGIWVPVPHTDVRVVLPDGWIVASQGRQRELRLRTEDQKAIFRATLKTGADLKPQAVLSKFAELVGGGVVTWGAAKKWKPVSVRGKAKGLFQSGKATLEGAQGSGTHHMLLFAHPVKGGVLLLAGTFEGADGADPRVAQLAAIAASFK